jgi:hypothetical protein
MKSTYISPLEQYVKSIVKQSNKRSLPKVYVRKALALIREKLNSSCCNGDATIDLITSRNNSLTLLVGNLVHNMSKQGNVHSLERTKRILNKFLGLCCGANHLIVTVDGDTINYIFNTNYVDEVTSYTVSLFDASTDVKVGDTQTFNTDLDVTTISGSFTTIDAGTYYINLVSNYSDGRAILFVSSDITV